MAEHPAPLRLAADFGLPLEAQTQTFAILAIRGAGKTYTGAVLVEELLKARLPVVVLDPVGVWWGLRASADGAGPGLPITILGGDHGDLPLASTAGGVVADLVVRERCSLVLDLSLLRKGEQGRFVTDFAEHIYHSNRAALHLVLDEADAFAPQHPAPGQQRMLGAVEDLVRRGRARGLGVTLITQRAAVIAKDVLTQVETLIALRTVGPQDRKALDAWIEAHGTREQRDALLDSLASLPTGTAWVWSPGWLKILRRVQIRRRETFDSSSTPKAGAAHVAPRELATVDLARIRAAMGATVPAAAPKGSTKGSAPTPSIDANALSHAHARIAQLEGELSTLRARTALVAEQATQVRAAATELERLVDRLLTGYAPAPVAPTDTDTPAKAPATRPPPPPRPRVGSRVDRPIGDLRKGAREMLATLARYPQLTRAELATLAGFALEGGTFGTYLANLRSGGYLEDRGGALVAAEAGRQLAGVTTRAPLSRDEILARWGRLRAGERVMLELVLGRAGGLTRAHLAEDSGYELTGGTFGTYLSTLRRHGLMEVAGDLVKPSGVWALVGTGRHHG